MTVCEFCQLVPVWRVLEAGRDWHERAPACRPCYVTARALWILALDGEALDGLPLGLGVAAHDAGVRDGEGGATAAKGYEDGNLRAGRTVAASTKRQPDRRPKRSSRPPLRTQSEQATAAVGSANDSASGTADASDLDAGHTSETSTQSS